VCKLEIFGPTKSQSNCRITLEAVGYHETMNFSIAFSLVVVSTYLPTHAARGLDWSHSYVLCSHIMYLAQNTQAWKSDPLKQETYISKGSFVC